jgi:hypothetical protein
MPSVSTNRWRFSALDAFVSVESADMGRFRGDLDALAVHDRYTGMRVSAHAPAFRLMKGP